MTNEFAMLYEWLLSERKHITLITGGEKGVAQMVWVLDFTDQYRVIM